MKLPTHRLNPVIGELLHHGEGNLGKLWCHRFQQPSPALESFEHQLVVLHVSQKTDGRVGKERCLDMDAHVPGTSADKIIVSHRNDPGKDVAFLAGLPHGIEGFLPDEIVVGDFGRALGYLLQSR